MVAAPFSDRMNEFDTVAVDHGEEAGLRQKTITPVAVGAQGTLQTGSIWQAAEKPTVIPLEPTVEGAEIAAFQRKQHPNRDQFTGIQLGLPMFGQFGIRSSISQNTAMINSSVVTERTPSQTSTI